MTGTPQLTDDQVEVLASKLRVRASLYITPPVDGAHDPLNQIPPSVGVKISLDIEGRPHAPRIGVQRDDGNWESRTGPTLPDTHLGQYGWILTPQKAADLQLYLNERLEPTPKRIVEGRFDLLHEGDQLEPS